MIPSFLPYTYVRGLAVDPNTLEVLVGCDNILLYDSEGNYTGQRGSIGVLDTTYNNATNSWLVLHNFFSDIPRYPNYGTMFYSYDADFTAPLYSSVSSLTSGPGNILFTATSNGLMEIDTFNGDLIYVWGCFGSGTSQFNTPEGIAYDSVNNLLYVSDDGNQRITVFRFATTAGR